MTKIKVLKKAEIRVMPADILTLEALRQGLRGDTLKKAYREGR
jgi:phosphosulfolactate synthase (CoM biosynthesis protein A)